MLANVWDEGGDFSPYTVQLVLDARKVHHLKAKCLLDSSLHPVRLQLLVVLFLLDLVLQFVGLFFGLRDLRLELPNLLGECRLLHAQLLHVLQLVILDRALPLQRGGLPASILEVCDGEVSEGLVVVPGPFLCRFICLRLGTGTASPSPSASNGAAAKGGSTVVRVFSCSGCSIVGPWLPRQARGQACLHGWLSHGRRASAVRCEDGLGRELVRSV
mmetsp:Transcript_69426/g.199134  ORF Transcript_69426/g.199134 Transcript_69426/m.199134 type:complete len:216 (+) Transcript_69426:617-1264(+)